MYRNSSYCACAIRRGVIAGWRKNQIAKNECSQYKRRFSELLKAKPNLPVVLSKTMRVLMVHENYAKLLAFRRLLYREAFCHGSKRLLLSVPGGLLPWLEKAVATLTRPIAKGMQSPTHTHTHAWTRTDVHVELLKRKKSFKHQESSRCDGWSVCNVTSCVQFN